MISLVGYTGFVGSNIYAGGHIDAAYNSKNIEEAFGTKPNLLIYAGLKAEKYLANIAPQKDMETIVGAEKNIEKIEPKKLVLISTIDVLKDPNRKDESATVETDGLQAYGFNRYRLEQWTREHYPDALIIRLPGLFGKNIKKNFIYDFINVIPFMLKKEKFEKLAAKAQELKEVYSQQENGFYKLTVLDEEEKKKLRNIFRNLGFTALNFTDSRATYQFYNLARLYSDIEKTLDAGLKLWHAATEPVSAGELYHYLTGRDFVNEIADTPPYYDYRTKYASIFGCTGEYIESKEYVLEEIKNFVKEQENE